MYEFITGLNHELDDVIDAIDEVEMSALPSSGFRSTGNEIGPPQFGLNSPLWLEPGCGKMGIIFLILGLLLDLLILENSRLSNFGPRMATLSKEDTNGSG